MSLGKSAKVMKNSTEAGYRVLSFDALRAAEDDEEHDKLEGLFNNQMSLMVGPPGVGKSSITNLLGPEIEQDVEDEGFQKRPTHNNLYIFAKT